METKVITKTSKAGKVSYEYYVDGKKVRTASRLYIAGTVSGDCFWSRLDLVGKGSVYTNAVKCNKHFLHYTFEETKNKYEEMFGVEMTDDEVNAKMQEIHAGAKRSLERLEIVYFNL